MIQIKDKSVGYLYSVEKGGPGSGVRGHVTAIVDKLGRKTGNPDVQRDFAKADQRAVEDISKFISDIKVVSISGRNVTKPVIVGNSKRSHAQIAEDLINQGFTAGKKKADQKFTNDIHEIVVNVSPSKIGSNEGQTMIFYGPKYKKADLGVEGDWQLY
jgi:hypothetical protein